MRNGEIVPILYSLSPQFELFCFVDCLEYVGCCRAGSPSAGSLLGHISGKRHIYCYPCVIITSLQFELGLQVEIGV